MFLSSRRTSIASVLACLTLVSACNGETLSAGSDDQIRGAITPAPAPSSVATIATFDDTVRAVAMDATDVYALSGRSVYRIPRDGSAAPRVVAPTMAVHATDLAVDADHVYWTTLDSGVHGGSVYKAPKRGGAPVLLASGYPRPMSIAVDDTTVFWANEGSAESQGIPDDGSVMSVSKSGGTPTVLVGNLQLPRTIALSGDSVLWGDYYTIRRVAKAGGPIATVDSRIESLVARQLFVENDKALYSSFNGDEIFVAPALGGGTGSRIATPPMSHAFAASGDYVFFDADAPGADAIIRRSLTGGADRTLASVAPLTGTLVNIPRILFRADAAGLVWADYWANYADGMHTAIRVVAHSATPSPQPGCP